MRAKMTARTTVRAVTVGHREQDVRITLVRVQPGEAGILAGLSPVPVIGPANPSGQ
jgi:hypothetical protein